MGLLDHLVADEERKQEPQKDVQVLDDALEVLARYEHRKHSVLNAAVASTDLLVKARAVVEVSSAAEPGKFVEAQERAEVTRVVRLAGELLAEQTDPVVEKLA
jgi:hypothetical protein